jgi:hypothetical protein
VPFESLIGQASDEMLGQWLGHLQVHLAPQLGSSDEGGEDLPSTVSVPVSTWAQLNGLLVALARTAGPTSGSNWHAHYACADEYLLPRAVGYVLLDVLSSVPSHRARDARFAEMLDWMRSHAFFDARNLCVAYARPDFKPVPAHVLPAYAPPVLACPPCACTATPEGGRPVHSRGRTVLNVCGPHPP